MKTIPFPICPHKNVQQFSECCLDCGYNIYTGEQDYERDQKKARKEEIIRQMREDWERDF